MVVGGMRDAVQGADVIVALAELGGKEDGGFAFDVPQTATVLPPSSPTVTSAHGTGDSPHVAASQRQATMTLPCIIR